MTLLPDLSLFERAIARQQAPPPVVRPPALVPRQQMAVVEQTLVLEPDRWEPIVGTAADVRISDPRVQREIRGTRQGWQQRAWELYGELGIVWIAVEIGGNTIGKLRLIAARQERPGEEPQRPDDPDNFPQQVIDELGRAVATPTGMDGLSTLMHDLGVNLRLTGECYLLGIPTPDGDVWDIVSTDELRFMGGRAFRVRYPGAPPEQIDENAVLKRIWNPSPQYSALATSPLRSALKDLDELSLLKDGGIAALRSRIALAGLLLLPSELDIKPVNPKEKHIPFRVQLMQAMETGVRDPRSVGRFVPLILEGKSQFLEKIRHLTLYDPEASAQDMERAKEIIRSFALSIDLPPEVLLGTTDVSRWIAWQVNEATWGQLKPTAVLAVNGLTHAYFRPALKTAGVADADQWVVWFDDSELGITRDRAQDAKDALDRDAISWEAYRRATNWDDSDAPSQEELAIRAALRKGQMAAQQPGIAPAEPGPGTPGGLGPLWPAEQPALPEVPQGAPTVGAATALLGTRAGTLRRLARGLAAIDRGLMTQLVTAADAALRRAAERAGSKIRSTIRGNGHLATLAHLLRETPNERLAMTLGPSRLATLQIAEDDLLGGTGAAFINRVRPWIARAQIEAIRRAAEALGQNFDMLEEATAIPRQLGLDRASAALERGFAQVALRFVMSGELGEERGEVSDLAAPRLTIREAMGLAGGNAQGKGLASGPLVQDILMPEGIRFQGWSWDYTGIARQTFPAHLALDGEQFEADDDPRLSVAPEDAWLGVAFYSPGDHEGCCCLAAPQIAEA